MFLPLRVTYPAFESYPAFARSREMEKILVQWSDGRSKGTRGVLGKKALNGPNVKAIFNACMLHPPATARVRKYFGEREMRNAIDEVCRKTKLPAVGSVENDLTSVCLFLSAVTSVIKPLLLLATSASLCAIFVYSRDVP